MRTWRGSTAVASIALLLGVLVVSQFRAQDVYSRSLQLETPASLTTLIAGLADRNSALRDEIVELRLRLDAARSSVQSGRFSLDEAQRELAQLRVFAAQGPARGPGVAVSVDGPFDEKAMSDLVNELRNAGAEAIAINGQRVRPRSWFGPSGSGAILLDGDRIAGPWLVSAIGAQDVIHVAITRTGGIIGQFELIYGRTRFRATKEQMLDLPAAR
ncbi:MAG TPA: DUF881 domain-containing protein [Candidatus Limnocylindria bacterium]|nr:DUF881 domain-containing protein [Candidatus Limnocylindria bacterium]